MGNLFTAPKAVKKRPVTKRSQNQQTGPNSSNRWARARSSRKDKLDDALLQEQALAAAILFRQQQQQNGGVSLPFDKSASVRYPNSCSGSKNVGQIPRSSSSRARSLTDPLLQPHRLVNQDVKLDNLETNRFVLVYGGGFGAWCWYKTIAPIEKVGFKATAVDLTGSGIHSFDINSITSLSQYVKPLLENKRTMHFDKVCMKPGKPLTFAEIYLNRAENAPVNKVLAFDLLGNPFGCLVCFHLFVVPTIHRLAGWANPQLLRLLKLPVNFSISIAVFPLLDLNIV